MNDSSPSRSEVRERFLSVETANVADVLDELGFLDQALSPDFLPRPADAGRLSGWAATIAGRMAPGDASGGDAKKMEACGNLPSDSVSVWSGVGTGVCFFGELIAIGMKERGCTGALVEGGVRDIAWLSHLGFPVYSRYRTPVQSIGRWQVEAWEVPVWLPGATRRLVKISPGDFILGDEDGVISIPADLVHEVLKRAEAMGKQEVEIREHLAAGLSLDEALSRFGHV